MAIPYQSALQRKIRGYKPMAPPKAPAWSVAPTGPAPPPPVSWEGDAILQGIKAQQTASLAGLRANALSNRKQALIDFGYDQNLSDLYPDQANAEAAKANPFSILANLAHQHTQREGNLNESLNKANLFYSGYRGKQLGEEGRQYLGEQAGASSALRNLLAGITTNLLSAESGSASTVSGAESDAYTRNLNQALASGSYGAPGPAWNVAPQAAIKKALQKKILGRVIP